MVFPRTPLYWAAITPSDTTDLGASMGLFVTVGGTVSFVGNGGTTVQITAPANFYLWADVRKVMATGTAATGIFLLR